MLRRELRARTRFVGGSAILDVFNRRRFASGMLQEARARWLWNLASSQCGDGVNITSTAGSIARLQCSEVTRIGCSETGT